MSALKYSFLTLAVAAALAAPVAEGLDGMVQIVEGLDAGDEVVVYSERNLDDGSRVKIVPALRGASR